MKPVRCSYEFGRRKLRRPPMPEQRIGTRKSYVGRLRKIVAGEEAEASLADCLHVGITGKVKTVSQTMPLGNHDRAVESGGAGPQTKWRMLDQGHRGSGILGSARGSTSVLRRLRRRPSCGKHYFVRPHRIGRALDERRTSIVT